MEAEAGLSLTGQTRPVAAGGFEQDVGAGDVGLDEVAGAVDGAVDVGFGGEMDDAGGLVLGKEGIHGGPIADVGVGEAIARGVGHRGQ